MPLKSSAVGGNASNSTGISFKNNEHEWLI